MCITCKYSILQSNACEPVKMSVVPCTWDTTNLECLLNTNKCNIDSDCISVKFRSMELSDNERFQLFPFIYRRNNFFSPSFINACMLYTDFILLANKQNIHIRCITKIIVCLSTGVSYACTVS